MPSKPSEFRLSGNKTSGRFYWKKLMVIFFNQSVLNVPMNTTHYVKTKYVMCLLQDLLRYSH